MWLGDRNPKNPAGKFRLEVPAGFVVIPEGPGDSEHRGGPQQGRSSTPGSKGRRSPLSEDLDHSAFIAALSKSWLPFAPLPCVGPIGAAHPSTENSCVVPRDPLCGRRPLQTPLSCLPLLMKCLTSCHGRNAIPAQRTGPETPGSPDQLPTPLGVTACCGHRLPHSADIHVQFPAGFILSLRD